MNEHLANSAMPKPKRRYLRFSLRAFLLVVLVACVWLGWKVEKARKQAEVVAWIEANGGTVRYDYEISADGKKLPNPTPTEPQWLRDMFGAELFDDVGLVYLKTANFEQSQRLAHLNRLQILILETEGNDLTPLARLRGLIELTVTGKEVFDISPVATLKNLKRLDVFCPSLTDLSPLSRLTKLERLHVTTSSISDISPLSKLYNLNRLALDELNRLDLDESGVNDLSPLLRLKNLRLLRLRNLELRDLAQLSELSGLTALWLSDMSLQDVTPLLGLKNLTRLVITGTRLPKEELDKLEVALPNCTIIYQ